MRQDSLVEAYITEVFAQEDSHLKAIREALKSDQLAGMQLGAPEGQMLAFLIRSFQIHSIVEVGTLYGYSALWMARALPEGGRLYTLEKDPERQEKAEKFLTEAGVGERVDFLCGDAVEKLEELSPQGPFDMVFIDANKSAYTTYLDWAEKNVRKGGLIIGDNTFLFGAVYGASQNAKMGKKPTEVMRSFNQRLADRDRYNSTLIPTQEGMTVAQKLF